MSQTEPPSEPDVPSYVLDGFDAQSPADLEAIAEYARQLAAYKRKKAESRRPETSSTTVDGTRVSVDDSVDDEELEELADDDLENEDVPSSAYVTIKETKPDYRYFYYQWRDGDSWKNEYIAPVNPKE